MELVARKNDLLKELSLLQGIVERKNTIPILANVLIQADKSGVSLLATDLDVGLRSKCEATVTKTGTLTLPAKKLFEIVSALPDTDIRIEEDKNGKSVTIAADRFESKMQTLPASEFPTPPQDAAPTEASLPGAMMLDSIYQLLVPLSVEPQKAWGGYYVFDMPKTAFRRKTDQPLTIVVRTGAREHRFAATLKWK